VSLAPRGLPRREGASELTQGKRRGCVWPVGGGTGETGERTYAAALTGEEIQSMVWLRTQGQAGNAGKKKKGEMA
jgi:hypothetical protein